VPTKSDTSSAFNVVLPHKWESTEYLLSGQTLALRFWTAKEPLQQTEKYFPLE